MTREQEKFLSAKNGSIRWKDAKKEWWDDPEFALEAIALNPDVLEDKNLFVKHFRDEKFVIAVGESVKKHLRSLIPDYDITEKKFEDIKLALEYKINRFEEYKLEIERTIDEQDNNEKNYSDERKAELERIISKI